MKYKQHLRIRITSNQMKELITRVKKDRSTMSEIIRSALKNYLEQNSNDRLQNSQ